MCNSRFKRVSVTIALAIFALAALQGQAQVLTLIPRQVESNATMVISADADGKPVGLVALSLKTDPLPAGVAIGKVALMLNIDNKGTDSATDYQCLPPETGDLQGGRDLQGPPEPGISHRQ